MAILADYAPIFFNILSCCCPLPRGYIEVPVAYSVPIGSDSRVSMDSLNGLEDNCTLLQDNRPRAIGVYPRVLSVLAQQEPGLISAFRRRPR